MAITLASISRAAAMKAPRMLLYGVPGIGKTTLAAQAEDPIFLLAEDGLGMLQVPHFPLARTYQDVLDALRALSEEEHAYRTLVIDSADAVEPLIWQSVCSREKVDSIEKVGGGYGKGLNAAAEEWHRLVQCLDYLREQRGMVQILIAHSAIVRHDAPDVASYDTYTIKLDKRAAPVLIQNSDAVLFANYRIDMVAKEDAGFGKQKGKAKGRGERVLYTEQRPAWTAKNRYALPPELPMSWAAIRDAIAGNAPAQNQEQ